MRAMIEQERVNERSDNRQDKEGKENERLCE
jgi:hypothetical protein